MWSKRPTARRLSVASRNRAKIVRRLAAEGWIGRHGGRHDVFSNAAKPGVHIAVPRHRTVTPGVAAKIAKDAGWS